MTTPTPALNLAPRLLQEWRSHFARQRPAVAQVRNADVAELHIYGVIGSSWWEEGITAGGIKEKLEAFSGASRLNIFINSPGGSVYEADAIYSQLERWKGEKVAYIDGLAASAASYIALAADRVVTAKHGKWLIHNASTVVVDVFTAASLRTFAERTAGELDKYSASIAELYVAKTGKAAADVLAQMDRDELMTAQEALDFGLTDSIATFAEDNAPAAAPAEEASRASEAAALAVRARLDAFRATQSLRKPKTNAAPDRKAP
ncbi:MAG: Clp protease ClpP [Myxococcaceae bacterium]|nr:Clp protease ClpP [Myxococcaceae bacterium]